MPYEEKQCDNSCNVISVTRYAPRRDFQWSCMALRYKAVLLTDYLHAIAFETLPGNLVILNLMG